MHNPRHAPGRFNPTTAVANFVRGMLIGLAELVPGVSGGTIALISGIYEPLINSASHVVSAVKRVVTGKFSEAGAEFRKVRWGVVIPALLGMAVVVVAMAGIMKVFVGETPQLAHALFLVAAIAAFFLTGLGAGSDVKDPPAWMIFGAAAVAICALVLPGVSGSFMLKIFGLYVPTMAAVEARSIGYLALFAAGAAVGLGLFVKGLNWLLEHKHAATMVWPWGPGGEPLAPNAHWSVLVALAVAGAVVVVGIVWVDRRLKRR